MQPETIAQTGLCFFCKVELGKGSYCWGCQEFICEDCDTNYNRGISQHDPEEHQDDLSGYDDDYGDDEYDE